jgi:hypothetical protein
MITLMNVIEISGEGGKREENQLAFLYSSERCEICQRMLLRWKYFRNTRDATQAGKQMSEQKALFAVSGRMKFKNFIRRLYWIKGRCRHHFVFQGSF